jgi:hypothetical protein
MNAKRTSTRAINPLQPSRILLVCFAALVFGGAGVCFVSLKNTQHTLGERVRTTERQLRELRARNQDYQSRIRTLTSLNTLRTRLKDGFIDMIPVQDTAIARLTPPAVAGPDGVARTASLNPVGRP